MSLYGPIATLDDYLLTIFSPVMTVAVWAALGATISMAIYAFFSPQERLQKIKEEYKRAQGRLIKYDGDFAGQQKIVREVLKLSIKRLVIVLGPTLLALPPFVVTLIWVDYAYRYEAPMPGASVITSVTPADAPIKWHTTSIKQKDGTLKVIWPTSQEGIILSGLSKGELVLYSDKRAVGVLWAGGLWSLIDPSANLSSKLGAEEIVFHFSRRDLTGQGPAWIRGWEGIYFATFIAFSLIIKFGFKIE